VLVDHGKSPISLIISSYIKGIKRISDDLIKRIREDFENFGGPLSQISSFFSAAGENFENFGGSLS